MADVGGKQEWLESEVREMKLKEDEADVDMDTIPVAMLVKEDTPGEDGREISGANTSTAIKRQSRSPAKQQSAADSPATSSDQEETIGGEVTVKQEPGKPPKLARSTSHKVEKRPPPLFLDCADRTVEAKSTFDVLSECTYANKYLGTTEPALECDCAEEWDPATRSNHACSEDSDCINRHTKMECARDCSCGSGCQNQRFQQKQYANVTVIKTEKKGYGLRANTELWPNDFIFEYIGEVIDERRFRQKMQQYDEEGIKHFYFMSLTKGEFVDATKRGNLGRFCNHSCNPNCYVDKWVVGDKLRMGIFAERKIKAGEELVFNYNVDRYGAEPQPCYCGEPNCTGYIGGKTQTERATKLSNTVIEALGIDDADAWDTAVAKRSRKKKVTEDDEEYVNNVEPRGLDEEGVNKVMSSLMQCKEKWIAVKLLTRIQRADDEKVRNRVVRFHGYRILKTALSNFMDDVNVCMQILDVLDKMPRLTRNKIQDSKIEEAVGPLTSHEDERVSTHAQALLDAWSKLEIAYRIPRVKRDPNATAPDRKAERFDRRDDDRKRSRSRSRTKSPERIQAPTGPRSSAPQRAAGFRPARFRPPPPVGGPLPHGWFEATAANGSVYFYNQAGTTTWQRPIMSATAVPAPPPPKAVSDQQMLNDLIKNIVASKKETTKQASAAATPTDTPKKERKEERWRSYPLEKQKKVYEGTLSTHVIHVAGKFRHKLSKDEIKRYSKELSKLVVEGDYRKNRVENPTKVSDEKIKDLKKSARAFFEKAVKKKEAAELKRASKVKKEPESHSPLGSPPAAAGSPALEDDEDLAVSDEEEADAGIEATPNESLANLKRRHEELAHLTDDELVLKKQRTESVETAPPPPPPPPPEQEDTNIADSDMGFSIKGAATAHSRPVSRNGGQSGQMATPPTTGSPDHDETEKATKRSNFANMNPQRLRNLGITDGASD